MKKLLIALIALTPALAPMATFAGEMPEGPVRKLTKAEQAEQDAHDMEHYGMLNKYTPKAKRGKLTDVDSPAFKRKVERAKQKSRQEMARKYGPHWLERVRRSD